MRAQGKSCNTKWVGCSIVAIACVTTPRIILPFSQFRDNEIEPDLQEITGYLRRVGRARDIGWVEGELRTVSLYRQAMRAWAKDESRLRAFLRALSLSVQWWYISLFLLALACGMAGLWLLLMVVTSLFGRRQFASLLALVSLLLIVIAGWWVYHSEACVFAAESANLTLILGTWLPVVNSWDSPASSVPVMGKFLDSLSESLRIWSRELSPATLRLMMVLGYQFTLLLLVALIALVYVIRDNAGGSDLTYGVRRAGMVVAGLLLLIYALCLPFVARAEREAHEAIDRFVGCEVTAYARTIGIDLTEPLPPP